MNAAKTLMRPAVAALTIAAAGFVFAFGTGVESPVARTYAAAPPAPERQTAEGARAKSLGCASCHTASDHTTMHVNTGVILGCTDCHGGDAKVMAPQGASTTDPAYVSAKQSAHVLPRYPVAWRYPSSIDVRQRFPSQCSPKRGGGQHH